MIIITFLLTYLLTEIEFSTGGSNPYTSTDKTHKNKIYINETIQKHSTSNTKHSKYKYTYYQNTHTYADPHITKQVKTTKVHDTHQTNLSQHNQVPST